MDAHDPLRHGQRIVPERTMRLRKPTILPHCLVKFSVIFMEVSMVSAPIQLSLAILFGLGLTVPSTEIQAAPKKTAPAATAGGGDVKCGSPDWKLLTSAVETYCKSHSCDVSAKGFRDCKAWKCRAITVADLAKGSFKYYWVPEGATGMEPIEITFVKQGATWTVTGQRELDQCPSR